MLGFAFAIGVVAGLRSFTAPAAVCWAAHLGWLHLEGSKLAFLGTSIAVYIASALALVELVLDKQAWMGARTKPGPLIDRLIMGALSGAALGSMPGAISGCVGALVGTYGGYQARRRIVANLKVPDIAVALVEDALAVGGALLIVSRF
ncbi:MAG TPA: DUF4126 family protein [Bryobacteraceae bacterium]|jgi:uncharacterized membrane protein|nr:DUF4126 family protein [Bryobacteraceae bacterium]